MAMLYYTHKNNGRKLANFYSVTT